MNSVHLTRPEPSVPHKVCGSFGFRAIQCYPEEKFHMSYFFFKLQGAKHVIREVSWTFQINSTTSWVTEWPHLICCRVQTTHLAHQIRICKNMVVLLSHWVLGVICYAPITETSTVHHPSSKIILPSSPFMLSIYWELFFHFRTSLHCYPTSRFISSFWGFISLIKHWSAMTFNYRSCYEPCFLEAISNWKHSFFTFKLETLLPHFLTCAIMRRPAFYISTGQMLVRKHFLLLEHFTEIFQ